MQTGRLTPLGSPMNLSGATFGKAKNVIFLWLQGGPPQHETFDPKPDAPVDIRGPFRPIATNVPGIRFCELLPHCQLCRQARELVRSLHTNDDNHDGCERLLVADGLSLRPRQRPPDQAERLAVLRLHRQDAQTQPTLARPVVGVDSRPDAAQRQRDPRGTDGRVRGPAVGAGAFRRRSGVADVPHRRARSDRRSDAGALEPPPRSARPGRHALPHHRARRRRRSVGPPLAARLRSRHLRQRSHGLRPAPRADRRARSLWPLFVGPNRAAGAALDRGRRAPGPCQLAARTGRFSRR